MSEPMAAAPVSRRRSPLVFLPLVLFLAFAGLVGWKLIFEPTDPAIIPSALIGKPVPGFALDPVAGLNMPGLSSADLRKGKITVVNVFASWCVPCHQEHPVLLTLPALGVNLVAIAYKDQMENTRRFLGQDGNPYAAVGADLSGRTGIDLGLTGVPETYIVSGDGIIADKIIGPITEQIVRERLLPAIAKAKGS
jgi:cytochrome c biogenesis protein CcmG/thiol:disulfide interchange protein DsbE